MPIAADPPVNRQVVIPYQSLSQAPKEIRRTAQLAQVANSISHATTILLIATIVYLLPAWFPGILQYETFPIALLVLLFGSIIVSRKGGQVRELIAAREFSDARGRSLSAAIFGFVIGGLLSGIAYVILYSRIGKLQEQPPGDPHTVYILPEGSNGVFLGRYFGWILAYLFVLYMGYTQLPNGLRGVSNWLSPVLGIHFNTMIVAAYLIFTNPVTNPQLMQIWIYAGFLGGIIAGGKIRRGHMVALSAFISTLGAMGLASLAISRSLSLASFPQIPGPPPGFSITDAATGPVASDILPLFLNASSFTDPSFLQQVLLILVRNAGLIFMIVTISGRVASLVWQGSVDSIRFLIFSARKPAQTKSYGTTLERPVLKTAIIILLILIPLVTIIPIGHMSNISSTYAPPATPGPYQEDLAIGLDRLGAPNATLGMTNLDLSSNGLVYDSNYANAQIAALVINQNYDGQSLGNNNLASQMLQFVSQPSLVLFYPGPASSSASQANNVAAQFSQALGVTFTPVIAITMGQGTMRLYAPNPTLSNNDALSKILGLLPNSSFSTLVNTQTLTNQKYVAMIGVVPVPSTKQASPIPISGLSFMMNIQYPRTFYKQGPHWLSLKTLLGFQNTIRGDPGANVSAINIDFQPGTILYSSLFPNPFYYNSTSTYILNVQSGTTYPDFIANFTYPFAPDIVIQKTITPTTGSVQTTYDVTLNVQNLDTVTVTNVNVTDNVVSQAYSKTLQVTPASIQSFQMSSLNQGNAHSQSYTVFPTSSGTYVLTPATVSFNWQAPNGTNIRYTINTSIVTLTSTMGPITQFTSSFNDLYPYSLLLILPLIFTPIVETFRMIKRRQTRPRQKFLGNSIPVSATSPQQTAVPQSPAPAPAVPLPTLAIATNPNSSQTSQPTSSINPNNNEATTSPKTNDSSTS